MEEPKTKMTAKPKPRTKPGIEQRRDLREGISEAPKGFENLNLKMYNLAIVRAKVNDYQ